MEERFALVFGTIGIGFDLVPARIEVQNRGGVALPVATIVGGGQADVLVVPAWFGRRATIEAIVGVALAVDGASEDPSTFPIAIAHRLNHRPQIVPGLQIFGDGGMEFAHAEVGFGVLGAGEVVQTVAIARPARRLLSGDYTSHRSVPWQRAGIVAPFHPQHRIPKYIALGEVGGIPGGDRPVVALDDWVDLGRKIRVEGQGAAVASDRVANVTAGDLAIGEIVVQLGAVGMEGDRLLGKHLRTLQIPRLPMARPQSCGKTRQGGIEFPHPLIGGQCPRPVLLLELAGAPVKLGAGRVGVELGDRPVALGPSGVIALLKIKGSQPPIGIEVVGIVANGGLPRAAIGGGVHSDPSNN